jgi:hypothetical protein
MTPIITIDKFIFLNFICTTLNTKKLSQQQSVKTFVAKIEIAMLNK